MLSSFSLRFKFFKLKINFVRFSLGGSSAAASSKRGSLFLCAISIVSDKYKDSLTVKKLEKRNNWAYFVI